jgi:hypothetical protein
METALSHSALPEFDRAQLGPISRDYPDLVLAAVLPASAGLRWHEAKPAEA